MSATTRAALVAAWDAARRNADCSGAIHLNAASFAGYLLAQNEGSVQSALGHVPDDGSTFFARVGEILKVVDSEGGAS